MIGAPRTIVAKNVLPELNAFAPLPGLAESTDALDDRCRGLVGVRDVDQAGRLFAGDSTKLYELSGMAWQDVSKSGGYGPAASTTRWRFTTFGDRLIATNFIDPVQFRDMSSGTAEFANLAGAPGIAEFVATYREFVFLGSLGTNGNMIKWSGFDDSEEWTPGSNQSDEQEFADGGRITGMVAMRSALFIFQERCIRRVFYVGGDVIFQIDKIVDGVGCIEPNSLAQYGQRCFFLSEDGFYQFNGESEPSPIGNEKFDRWFLETSNRAYWYAMSAAIDPRHKMVVWLFPSLGSGSETPSTVLFYNYAVDRQSYGEIDAEIVASAVSLGVSPDDLTDYVPDDHPEIGPDDPFWLGGSLYLSAMSPGHKLASFGGAALEATIDVGVTPLFDGRRASVDWVKPISDATDATCAAGAQVRPGDAITYQNAAAQQASGRCPQRGANGFYAAFRTVIPSGAAWTYARGVEFQARAAGVR